MRNALAVATLVASVTAVMPAHAQVFGQFTGATTVAPNEHLMGGYLNVSENVLGGMAQLRLSFYQNVDFGFHGGLSRLDPSPTSASLTVLRVGTDVRWQISQAGAGSPVDVAVGGALGIETADDLKVVSVGPSAVVSRTMSMGGGGIVPYGGMAINFSSRDAFGIEDSDISVPLRFGLEARLSQELRIVAELQLFIADKYNDDVGLVAGVNLPF